MKRQAVCAAISLVLVWCASAAELGSITLTVQDKQGQPVPGASVVAINWNYEIVRTEELRDNEKGTTDEKGLVTFHEKTIGQVFVRVQAGDQGGWFRVQDRGEEGPVTLTLGTGQTVTGTVRDASGTPVAAARVLADSCLPIGETDAQGRFSVTNYGVGYSPELIFAKEGFVPDGTHVHFEAAEVSISLKRAVAIQGRVVMPDGSPAKDARIGAGIRGAWELKSGANGEFTISALPLGEEVTISASCRANEIVYQARQRVTVTDPPPGPVTLQLDEVKFGSVRGRVVHASTGEPVTGRVLLDTSNEFYNPRKKVETNKEGHFAIEGLYPGGYWLFAAPVTKTLYMVGGPKQVSVTEGTLNPEVELSVDDGCALRGSVLAADGTPIAGLQIMWQPMPNYRAIWTDEAGKFIIPYLDGAGVTYTIEVSDELQRAVSKTVGPLEKGQIVSDIELRMLPPMMPATLRGSVRDETGSPLPNVRLRFRYTESGCPWGVEVTSDAKGEFSTQIVRGGPVEVAASIGVQIEREGHSDNLSRECEVLSTKTLTLEEGKDVSLDLTVRTAPMGILAGTVSDPDGKPLNASLNLVYDGKEQESLYAYREGEFMFQRLPRRPYLLEVTAPGHKARMLRPGVEFVEGDAPVAIVLRPGPFAYDESVWETVTGTPATQESVDAYPEAKYVREREWSYHEKAKRPKRDETQQAGQQPQSYRKPLRILDDNGEPLKRVIIEELNSLPDYEVLLYKSAGRQVQPQSSDTGVYALPLGSSYGAIVSAPGLARVYVQQEWTDKPGMTQDVVLRRPAALELMVRDEKGKALPNIPVCTAQLAWGAETYLINNTGDDGTLRLDTLSPGFHGFAVGEGGGALQLVLVNLESGKTRKEVVQLVPAGTRDNAQSLLQQWRKSKVSGERTPEQMQVWIDELKTLPEGVHRNLRKAVRHNLDVLPDEIGWDGWLASEQRLLSALATHLRDKDAVPILKKELRELQSDKRAGLHWGKPHSALIYMEAIVALEGEKAVDYFAELAADASCDRGSRIAALIALGQIGTEKSAAAFKRLREAAYDCPNAPPKKETYTHAERMAETAHMIIWVLTTDASSPLARPFNPNAFTNVTVSEDYSEGNLNTTMFGGWTDLHFRRIGDEWLLQRIGPTMVT